MVRFGWHGENHDIVDRLLAGFGLHRAAWDSSETSREVGEDVAKIDYLADFLRSGLLPPPTLVRPLRVDEARGKVLFESNETGCVRCHVTSGELTDRGVMPLRALPVRSGFDRGDAMPSPSLF